MLSEGKGYDIGAQEGCCLRAGTMLSEGRK